MRDLLSRAVFDKTFEAYRYTDGDAYHFMEDVTFETRSLTADTLGDDKDLLAYNLVVNVQKSNGNPIALEIPSIVEMTITQTEEGARGNTASGSVTKPATTDTGLEIQVPLFSKEGERVKVHTERASSPVAPSLGAAARYPPLSAHARVLTHRRGPAPARRRASGRFLLRVQAPVHQALALKARAAGKSRPATTSPRTRLTCQAALRPVPRAKTPSGSCMKRSSCTWRASGKTTCLSQRPRHSLSTSSSLRRSTPRPTSRKRGTVTPRVA